MTRPSWVPYVDDRFYSKADVHGRVGASVALTAALGLLLSVLVWNVGRADAANTEVTAPQTTGGPATCSLLNGYAKVVVAGAAADTVCSTLVADGEGFRRVLDQNPPAVSFGRACEYTWDGADATVWLLRASVPAGTDRTCGTLARINGTETFYAPHGEFGPRAN